MELGDAVVLATHRLHALRHESLIRAPSTVLSQYLLLLSSFSAIQTHLFVTPRSFIKVNESSLEHSIDGSLEAIYGLGVGKPAANTLVGMVLGGSVVKV